MNAGEPFPSACSLLPPTDFERGLPFFMTTDLRTWSRVVTTHRSAHGEPDQVEIIMESKTTTAVAPPSKKSRRVRATGRRAIRVNKAGIRSRAHRKTKPPYIRLGTTNRKPSAPSSASADIRHGQAIFYLTKVFDHKAAFDQDLPTMILAKVVCNLRNYYLQNQESTVELIRTYFNPKSADVSWSPEAVRLMWECVARFTPSLGLVDETAIADQRREFLENEVVDLIAWTVPGDRDEGRQEQGWRPSRPCRLERQVPQRRWKFQPLEP